MRQKDFDLSIFKRTSELKEKFGIHFDHNRPVPADDDLADRVFEAGKNLFIDIGIYNISSGRVFIYHTVGPEKCWTHCYCCHRATGWLV